MNTISRPKRDVPVWGEYDVAVVGGGFAGVASAVAAARNGAKVALIEKYACLGGLGTMGHVVIYLAICDGMGRQVSFGLAEELMKLPMKHGKCRPNGVWSEPDPMRFSREERMKRRYELAYDPGPMMIGLERMLVDAGVDVIYDTLVVDSAHGADGAITHLVVENKSGCGALGAKMVVDCSGDADICAMSGEDVEVNRRNHGAAWYYSVDGKRNVQLQCCADPYDSADSGKHPCFDGVDFRSVTRNVIYSRAAAVEHCGRLNADRAAKGEECCAIFSVPCMPCFRMSRRLKAERTITTADMHRWCDDAVGVFPDWRKPGPVYPLPWKSLIGVKTPNLLAAGRCMSSEGDAWDVTRVIPVCSVTGEAAGTTAALAVSRGKSAVADLNVADVQAQLVRQGVRLDPELVGKASA